VLRGYVIDKKRMEDGTFLDEDYAGKKIKHLPQNGLL
jgi:hypothetical protein